jgi:hypothetical protein
VGPLRESCSHLARPSIELSEEVLISTYEPLATAAPPFARSTTRTVACHSRSFSGTRKIPSCMIRLVGRPRNLRLTDSYQRMRRGATWVPVLCRRLFFAQCCRSRGGNCVMISHCRNSAIVDHPRPPLSPRASPEDLSIVYVVNDDISIREMLSSLFRSVGLVARFSQSERIACCRGDHKG